MFSQRQLIPVIASFNYAKLYSTEGQLKSPHHTFNSEETQNLQAISWWSRQSEIGKLHLIPNRQSSALQNYENFVGRLIWEAKNGIAMDSRRMILHKGRKMEMPVHYFL